MWQKPSRNKQLKSAPLRSIHNQATWALFSMDKPRTYRGTCKQQNIMDFLIYNGPNQSLTLICNWELVNYLALKNEDDQVSCLFSCQKSRWYLSHSFMVETVLRGESAGATLWIKIPWILVEYFQNTACKLPAPCWVCCCIGRAIHNFDIQHAAST